MAKDVLEIRIHGRGGQGGKTAAQFIAESAMDEEKFVQAFPEYGPERSGAPVTAYARISDEKLRLYQPVHNPDIVLVIDPTLIGPIDVTEGMTKEGIVIVNTAKSSDVIKKQLGFEGKVYCVDATKISIDATGVNKPNLPILGALVKISGAVSMKSLEGKTRQKFTKKIGEEKTQATVDAMTRAFNEVQ